METKTCKELFEGMECTILGDADQQVTGLAYRSDQVVSGNMFFCVVGLTVDGHTFAQDALDRGAQIIVAERTLNTIDTSAVTLVIVGDTRKALAHASAQFYDRPSSDLEVVGITGTNGKTTTTYLVDRIVRKSGKKTGLIGTTGIRVGDDQVPSSHTTPESLDLQKLFGTMRDAGCDTVSMEVSSHALDLERTWGITFAVTAFTNLSQDHLDYHKTFESYFESKARLFSSQYPAKRVICIDDKYGQELFRRCTRVGDQVITTGFSDGAQIRPRSVEYGEATTTVTLEVMGENWHFAYPLVGKFNVSNVMTALAVGIHLGIPNDMIIRALSEMPQIPGRLERVADEQGGRFVYVDYSHTPDALEKALNSLKAIAKQRIIVVFGCGGDRDRAKRPLMGRAALEADHAIVTSDNPRSEDPQAIINDILPGMKSGEGHYEIEPDRRSAIRKALAMAHPGDCVLVAGKGHEDYQIIGTEVLDFDDRIVISEELCALKREN